MTTSTKKADVEEAVAAAVFKYYESVDFLKNNFSEYSVEKKGETAKVYYTLTHIRIAYLCCACLLQKYFLSFGQRKLQCERQINIFFLADVRFKITKKYLKVNKEPLRI